MTILAEPIGIASPPRPKTTADVLRHAARYIEEHGWCCDTYAEDDGRVCGWGALNAVINGDPFDDDESPSWIAANDAVAGLVGSLPDYNDTPGRTAAEVIAALRAAAEASDVS